MAQQGNQWISTTKKDAAIRRKSASAANCPVPSGLPAAGKRCFNLQTSFENPGRFLPAQLSEDAFLYVIQKNSFEVNRQGLRMRLTGMAA